MGTASLQLARCGSPASRELLPALQLAGFRREVQPRVRPVIPVGRNGSGGLGAHQGCRLRKLDSVLETRWTWRTRRQAACAAVRAASSTAGLQTSSEQDAAEMVRWLQANGAETEGVRVARDGRGGLGLAAAAACRAGERLLLLPPPLQFTYGESAPTPDDPSWPALLELIQSVPEPLWALRLGLRLLSERSRQGSFWGPYLRCLPQRYSVPIFFPPAAVAELAYPPLVEQVKKRSRFLLQLSAESIPAILGRYPPEQHPFGGQPVDAGALGWAMAAVSSRAFRVRGPRHPAALLPLVDMCNHNPDPSAALRGVAGAPGHLEVVALQALPAGAPVELCYGELSNDLLLLDYGFVLPGCPQDRVELRWDPALLELAAALAKGVPPAGPALKAHAALLTKLRLAGPQADLLVTLGGSQHVDGRLLAATRSFCASDRGAVAAAPLADLQAWGARPPLGRAVEQKTLRTLAGLCALLLGQFPAPPAPGAAPPAGAEQRLAVAFRMEKHRVLVEALRFLQSRLKGEEA